MPLAEAPLQLVVFLPFEPTMRLIGSNRILVMRSIRIEAGNNPYEVLVGPGLLDQAGSLLARKVKPSSCAIVSDSNVAPLYAERVMNSLTNSGFAPVLITIQSGEEAKTIPTAEMVCAQMSNAGLDRSSIVIALGGGVVGDLAGFAAAVFHRGIRYAHMPTTLLAQVDSSIGGKTGVNSAPGKNMIGAWHHPLLVAADVDALATLPPREWKQGFAEVIKHAVISDAEMFEMLQRFDRRDLASLICRNIEIKGRIVAADERETKGERTLLNFGHTIGHAIEKAGEYRRFQHGEAVGLGMVAASEISRRKAGLSTTDQDRIKTTLEAFDLPIRLPADFSRDRIIDAIRFDKKIERQEIRFVVTPSIGSARVVKDVTMEDIRRAIESFRLGRQGCGPRNGRMPIRRTYPCVMGQIHNRQHESCSERQSTSSPKIRCRLL